MKRALALLFSVALVLTACGGNEPDVELEPEPVEEPEPEPDPAPEPEPEPEPEPAAEPSDNRPTSFLTGERIDEDAAERPLMIVKIDNAPEARPQTGLEAADVVIEEVVEAGVTRFMAMFHSELPAAVGPTRSARPVDAQLITAFGRSGFIYSGARPEVQGLLARTPALQVAEGGPGFYRFSQRRAPHNLYNRLPEALHAIGDREPDLLGDIGWEFSEELPDGNVTCPSGTSAAGGSGADAGAGSDDAGVVPCDDPGEGVTVAMTRSFTTGWEYDAPDGVYRRSQNGAPFLVTGPNSIGAANVVLLQARHYLGAPNCYGSPCPETDATTEGSRAVILRDGRRYEASWRKPDADSHIVFLDHNGRPFPLKPGPTWILLPSEDRMPTPVG